VVRKRQRPRVENGIDMKAKGERLLAKKNKIYWGDRGLVESCGGDKGNNQTGNGRAALVDSTIAL
jgi:hypothetical protein